MINHNISITNGKNMRRLLTPNNSEALKNNIDDKPIIEPKLVEK